MKSNFKDQEFQIENDRLEAQLEMERERRDKND